MDGVTILQVIENAYRPDWAGGVITLCAVVGLFIAICGLVLFANSDTKGGCVCLLVAVICLVALIIIMVAVPKVPETTYKVLVDDTVNMNEFFQTYKLVRQEGLIYVVKPIG